MSNVALPKDAEDVDYLVALRKQLAETKAGNTSSSNFTPEFILDFFNQIDISNSVTLNSNKLELANQIDISNNKYMMEVAKGNYLIGADNNDQYLSGKKWTSDGASEITIIDRAYLEPTAEITIAVRCNLSGFTGTRRQIVHKADATTGYRVFARANENTIRAQWYDGSGQISSQEFTFTPGTEFTLVASFRSGNQDLYKDGSLEDSNTNVATMGTNSLDVGYGGTAVAAELLANGDTVEHLVITPDYKDSTWASRYNNRQADLTDSADRLAGKADFMVVQA